MLGEGDRQLSYLLPTVGGEQEEGGAGGLDPGDLVDLLLNLQTLEVVKLGLVALEGAVDVVVTAEH